MIANVPDEVLLLIVNYPNNFSLCYVAVCCQARRSSLGGFVWVIQEKDFFGALIPLKRRFDVAGLQSVIPRLPPIECVTLRFPDSFAPLSFDLGFDGGGWEFAHLLNIILERQCLANASL